MTQQYDDDDDDLFDSTEEDEEEAESDLSADSSKVVHLPSVSRNMPASRIARAQPVKRRLRVRPMAPRMMAKYPEVVSILLTREDGRQLVFVRR